MGRAASAKAERKIMALIAERDRLLECIIQAHDRLHKEDIEACHEMLHQGLGSGELDTHGVAELHNVLPFDAAFRDLCLANRVRAAYVILRETDGMLLSGGDAEVDAYINKRLSKG